MTSPEQEPPSKLPMGEYGHDERYEPLSQEVERWPPKSNKNSNKEAPSMEQEPKPTTGGRRRRTRRTKKSMRMKKSMRTKKSRQTRKSKKRTHSRRHRRRH